MTTVKSKATGRVYDVKSQLYGTSNLTHSLYFGGIPVATTGGCSSFAHGYTMAEAIAIADETVDELGIEYE